MRNWCAFLLASLLLLAPIFGADAAQAPSNSLPWLHTRGTDIVDSTGKVVLLRGFNLGGALVIEPWLAALDLKAGNTQFPKVRDEKTLWEVLEQRFGKEKTAELQRAWRTSWANAGDIQRLANLGANVVRIPFWYAEVEDPAHPNQLNADGVKLLDDLVDACAKNHVYAILDLHGAPGGQSKEDHTGEASRNELFRVPALQARTAHLWTALARHFRDRPEVAGYDLLNEPMGAPSARAVLELSDTLYRAVRAADDRHMVIIEDGYKGDAAFPANSLQRGWRNVVFSKHHYLWNAKGIEDHRKWIADEVPKLRRQQRKWNVPIYIGEFSAVTARQGGIPAMADYFAAFTRAGWSWTPWTYKQISATGTRHNVWSLYSNPDPWKGPNPYTDSFETLLTRFRQYDTGNLEAQEEYREAFAKAIR